MLVQTLFWIALPGICYGLLAAWLLPTEPRHRWRTRLAAVVARRQGAPSGRRRRAPSPPDPFAVLALQVRLGVVATQLRELEDDATAWARARRLEATRAAYDDLLAEACRLAGVPEPGVPEPDGAADRCARHGEPARFTAEMELAARGWSW